MEIPPSRLAFQAEMYKAWLHTLAEQFGGTIPEAAYWYDSVNIYQVLRRFGSVNSLTCAILPNGGWYDLRGASQSNEPSFIELHLGGFTYMCKPHSLWFQGLGDANGEQWSYFHLHSCDLMPIRPTEFSHTEYFQQLTQLSPGEYANSHLWQTSRSYNQAKLPTTTRPVTRWLSGSMLLMLKSGPYFQDLTIKHGEHSSVMPDQVRGLIEHRRDSQRSKE
jgi:hypothetical protein